MDIEKALDWLEDDDHIGYQEGWDAVDAVETEIENLRAEVKRLRELCGKAAGVCRIYNYGPLCAALEAAAKGEK